MPASKIYTERQFGDLITRLYPEAMSRFPGWNFYLTVIYTHGKDIYWAFDQKSHGVKGAVSDAFIDKEKKLLIGGAVLDIQQIIISKSSQSLRLNWSLELDKNNRLSLPECRYEILKTLAHEFYHFVQIWHGGDTKTFKLRRLERIFEHLAKRIKKDHPDWSKERILEAAYYIHPTENIAEFRAKQSLEPFKLQIYKGIWDQYIPIEDIRQRY